MIKYPKLALIAARARNNVIGIDGDLPWKISSDLKFFKRVTLGKPVLMGRVTWESLPFPLPGRPNLVLTRNPGYKAQKAEVYTEISNLIGRGYELAGELNVDEVMLIGGARLYQRLLPICDRMYITDVQTEIEGDAVFPDFDETEWELVQSTPQNRQAGDDFDVVFNVYDRK